MRIYAFESKVVALKITKKKVVLQTFDPATLNVKSREEFDFGGEYLGQSRIGERIIFWYAQINKAEKRAQIFFREVQLNALTLGEAQLLFETDWITRKSGFFLPVFSSCFNGDKTELVIWSKQFAHFAPKEVFTVKLAKDVNFVRLDQDLKVVSRGSSSFDMTTMFSDVESITPLSDNKLIINVALVDVVGFQTLSNAKLFSYLISGDGKPQNIRIIPTDKYIMEAGGLELNDINYLVYEYSSSPEVRIEGLYFSEIVPSGADGVSKQVEFGEALISQYVSKGYETNYIKESIRTVKFVALEDESTLVIIEAKSLYAIKLGKNLDVIWSAKIPKANFGRSIMNNNLTYDYQLIRGKHVFVILDAPTNEDLEITISPRASGYKVPEDVLRAYMIKNKTGEVSQKLAVNWADVGGYQAQQFILPRHLVHAGDGKYFFEIYIGGKEELVGSFNLFD